MQLTNYLSTKNLLHSLQHGFLLGRSTVTNMLSFDGNIATIILKKHPYDILFIDFKKAFDKTPHKHVLNDLVRIEICDNALTWFETFLHGSTQQVRVGDCLSSICYVTSDAVQGATLGLTLYYILTDPLLREFTVPEKTFADDVKFIADVQQQTKAEVQAEIGKVIS